MIILPKAKFTTHENAKRFKNSNFLFHKLAFTDDKSKISNISFGLTHGFSFL